MEIMIIAPYQKNNNSLTLKKYIISRTIMALRPTKIYSHQLAANELKLR